MPGFRRRLRTLVGLIEGKSRQVIYTNFLDEIGEGIQDLAEIAQMQGEEVAHQTQMLENLHTRRFSN